MNPYCRLSNGLSASYCFHQVNPENEQSPHLILQVLGENQSANELVAALGWGLRGFQVVERQVKYRDKPFTGDRGGSINVEG